MTVYPCTNNPICKNVSGHRTPVCPNDTVKHRYKSTAKQLKDSVLEEYDLSTPKEVRYFNNPYGYRSGKYEIWDADRNKEGLYWRKYIQDESSGYVLEGERWFPGKGPDNVEQCLYNPETGIVIEKWWEPGKGPDGLRYRMYELDGVTLRGQEWEDGRHPDGLHRQTYRNGALLHESWWPNRNIENRESCTYYHPSGYLKEEVWKSGNSSDGIFIRKQYYKNGKINLERWSPGSHPDNMTIRSHNWDGKLVYEEWEPGKGPGGITSRKHGQDGNIIDKF